MSKPDEILVLLDDPPVAERKPSRTWKVAVIDDDHAVHEGTRFVLSGYSLQGRTLELVCASSAAEGRDLMRRHPDVAVVLLDVIMETDTAGLELVEYIRRDLGNELVRIILRTGQPGQAPERSIIVDYDINDYKSKTELTADRFFTMMTAALRSYEQLHRMEQTSRGLGSIIEATPRLFAARSMPELGEGFLAQAARLLGARFSGVVAVHDAGDAEGALTVLARAGRYAGSATGEPENLPADVRAELLAALAANRSHFGPLRSTLLASGKRSAAVALVEVGHELSGTDRSLLTILSERLAAALDNAALYQQLERAKATLERRVEQRTAELEAANRRLEFQWQRARRTNAFQSEILGTVAHDLKNPLSVILGRTEMLNDLLSVQPLAVEQARSQLSHIRESARRLAAMSETLIAEAMADALDISIRREPADLAALVREVVEANRPLADRKQQTMVLDGFGPIEVLADHDRMREAVDNLVSNAIKYSAPGGLIEVVVDRAGERARVQVIDSGPGLLPEDRARLFGRFQRLSARPTGGETSTGLGLSIAKKIVDLHGGELTAEPHPSGRGTNFVLMLAAEGDGA